MLLNTCCVKVFDFSSFSVIMYGDVRVFNKFECLLKTCLYVFMYQKLQFTFQLELKTKQNLNKYTLYHYYYIPMRYTSYDVNIHYTVNSYNFNWFLLSIGYQ